MLYHTMPSAAMASIGKFLRNNKSGLWATVSPLPAGAQVDAV
ncbi:hypothetical protein [Nocardia nova]|nr:hypothetical protein [Nocardia nova]